MILVAFLRLMPGMTFLRITTTRGIEFSQSLCKMTLQGRSGLALLPVRVPAALLICVAVIKYLVIAPNLAIKCATDSRSNGGRSARGRAYPKPIPIGFHAFHKPDFPPR